MVHKDQKRLTAVLALLAVSVISFAQNTSQTDSLVRLQKATSLELIQKEGLDYRKAVDATFLHNGTYLICDTALWNVDSKTIECEGNVQLIQEETILTSERLNYLIDEDLAQFRGNLVQLANKKNNILRTRNLDYNTRDSIAFFRGGAAMQDEDGQIIESDSGTYESARRYFTFVGNVNMFTDSVFVKTSRLEYDSEGDMARFVSPVDFWQEDNMLSAGEGWYDHNREVFFFRKRVHGLTKEQESWSDSLYFYKNFNNVLMLGDAQVQDTTRNVSALADYIFYEDSLSRVTLRRKAAVAIKNEQSEKVDTVYCGADALVYETIRKCDIPDADVKEAEKRFTEIMDDAVEAFRKRSAEEREAEIQRRIQEAEEEGTILPGLANSRYAAAAAAAAESEDSSPAAAPLGKPGPQPSAKGGRALTPVDKGGPVPADIPAPADTLASPVDSLASVAPLDTTKIGFLQGIGNVRIFKSDMQVYCDSLRYTDLDSIARFYNNPIVWNEEVRQYTSDSLFVLVKGGKVDRASLISNAFIACEENETYYDQIKGTDVVAFFGEQNELRRFDALGGVTARFYLKENDVIATVNVVECKMMSATLKDGNLERVNDYTAAKNDAFPVVQLPDKEHRLKGFDWRPDQRPKSKDDVTSLEVKPSERRSYESRPRAVFTQTGIYFPGYMDGVYTKIEESKIRRNTPRQTVDPLPAPSDSLSVVPEPLPAAADTTASVEESLPVVTDSLSVVSDSLSVVVDSLSVTAPEPETVDPRQERRDEREQARRLRIARRDAIWAEKDAADAAKAEAKAQKELEKKREKTRKQYIKQCEQDAEDAAKLQKYVEKYRKQKEKKDNKDERTKESD